LWQTAGLLHISGQPGNGDPTRNRFKPDQFLLSGEDFESINFN
jgi:hypothetical protein